MKHMFFIVVIGYSAWYQLLVSHLLQSRGLRILVWYIICLTKAQFTTASIKVPFILLPKKAVITFKTRMFL